MPDARNHAIFLTFTHLFTATSIYFIVKNFRHIIITALLTIGAFSSIIYISSCKDKCGSTTCQNGGTCSSNVCICPTGYSGSSCSTGWSTVYLGTYNCTRANCSPAVTTVNNWQSVITVDASNSGYTVDISNFDGGNTTVVAIVDSVINGKSHMTISPAAGSYGVNATGTFDSTGNVINLEFTAAGVGGAGGYRCNMVMTKIL